MGLTKQVVKKKKSVRSGTAYLDPRTEGCVYEAMDNELGLLLRVEVGLLYSRVVCRPEDLTLRESRTLEGIQL